MARKESKKNDSAQLFAIEIEAVQKIKDSQMWFSFNENLKCALNMNSHKNVNYTSYDAIAP